MFSVRLKIVSTRWYLKNLAPFKHIKADTLLRWFNTIGGQCISMKGSSKFKHSSSRKCIWKCRRKNAFHFDQTPAFPMPSLQTRETQSSWDEAVTEVIRQHNWSVSSRKVWVFYNEVSLKNEEVESGLHRFEQSKPHTWSPRRLINFGEITLNRNLAASTIPKILR